MKPNNMKSIFTPRTRMTQVTLTENPLRPWQRYIAVFMAYFFLLQLCLPTVAIAATLFSSDDFSRVLSSPSYRATGKVSGAMYARPSYLQVDTQSGVTIAGFYTQLSPTKEALPDTTLVIGDEFVQQRLIRAQLNMMLGRTLINKEGLLLNSDNKKAFELDQNDALFAAGVQFGNNAAKAFGTPLIAQDTIVNNMIWPEKRIISGAEVVIPVVYLNPATLATKPEGHYIQWGLSTLFNNLEVNKGVVVSALGNENYQAVINALNNIKNAGSINGSGNLELVAGKMLLNLSGKIKANNNLDIRTEHGDVTNKTLLLPYRSQNGSGTRLAAIATIDSANGNIKITSGGGITYEGGISNALNGALTFNANGDIVLAPVGTSSESTTKDGSWTINSSSFELMQSKLTTKQMITLMAGGKITITASELHSTEGGIELLAKHGIYIADEQGHFQSNRVDKIGRTQGTGSDFESFAVRSVLSAGKGILLATQAGDIKLKGAKITSSEGTQVKASNGKVRLLVTKENSQHYLDTVKKGTWTIKTVHEEYVTETGIPNAIVGGLAVEALLGVDIEYAGREGTILANQIDEYAKMPDTKWMADLYYGHTQVKDKNGNLVALNFSQVELAYKYVREHNTNLSPAAMAIIAICVAVALGGAGAGLIGTGSNAIGVTAATAGQTLTLSAAAMQAGVLTLATSAAQNLAAGKSLEDTLKSMTTDDALKNLAISMATAGALSELGGFELFNEAQVGATPQLAFANQAFQAVTNSVVTAGISVTINGGNSDDYLNAFKVSLATNAINTLGEHMATKIGKAFDHGIDSTSLDTALKYIAHAGSGCIIGAATAKVNNEGDSQGACYAAAGGAVIGEYIGSKYRTSEEVLQAKDALDNFIAENGETVAALRAEGYSNQEILDIFSSRSNLPYLMHRLDQLQQKGVDLAKLGAALSAFAAGAEASQINIAASMGATTAENNALFMVGGSAAFIEAIDALQNGTLRFSGGVAGCALSIAYLLKDTSILVYDLQQAQLFLQSGGLSGSKESLEKIMTLFVGAKIAAENPLKTIELIQAYYKAQLDGAVNEYNDGNHFTAGVVGGKNLADIYGILRTLPELASLAYKAAGSVAPTGIGKIEGSYSAIKPGPLDNQLAGSFSGGRYVAVTLAEDTILYRAGDSEVPLGQFFSSEPPVGVIQTRIDKAVLPTWPGGATSPINTIYGVKIPKGTTVYVGEVGYQNGFYLGGTEQIVIPKSWDIDGVLVINKSVIK